MNHAVALMIKSALVMFILLVVLSLVNGYPVWNTIWLSLIVIFSAYVIGDLLILRATNNAVSTVADIGLCTLVIWIVGSVVLNAPVPFLTALLSALLIGAGEWFFHKYLAHAILGKNTEAYS